MKRLPYTLAALAVVAICLPVFSQFNLNTLYSRGVSSGISAMTKIDSLQIETKVNSGVVSTMLTMTVTPDLYRNCQYYTTFIDSTIVSASDTAKISELTRTNKQVGIYRYAPDTSKLIIKTYTSGYTCSGSGDSIDSVEITANFNLPTDFTAKNLYLWVNGERQTGYIQDRALASQQYNQIVGKRRDPALLEFWGNGSYNLRIFPAKSLVSRKVAIEFQHTFDDDSLDFITAVLPFQYDSSNLYYNYATNLNYPIGYMRLLATSGDSRSYVLNVPGLGGGTFSYSAPLTLERNTIGKLSAGAIRCKDPSGSDEFTWAAPDKNKKTTFGFSTKLSKSTVNLDPEPDTRIIVLDIQNQTWNYNDYYQKSNQYTYPWATYTPYSGYTDIDLLLRAKKTAILCLQTYVAQNQKFNIVLTQPGSQTPSVVFKNPVAPTEENLALAFAAIIDAKPSAPASREALTLATTQAPKGIVIFISDLYRPYNYGKYADNTYSNYTISDDGKRFDSLIANLSGIVTSSKITLFTVCDESSLMQIAYSAGGYNVANLRWNSYYRRIPCVVDGKQQTALQLPPLYGYYYGQGISGLSITAPDFVTDCAFTADGYGYYYYRGGIALEKKSALSKSTIMVAPYYYYRDSAMFRFAAKLSCAPPSSPVTFTISGKMFGLNFSKKISADMSSAAGTFDASENYGLWALRKAEQFAVTDWYKNADSIKLIGLDNHIVTRQTSLLALEPGMTPLKDTINPSSTSNPTTSSKAGDESIVSDRSSNDPLSISANLDSISLDDLLAKKAGVLGAGSLAKNSDVFLSFSRTGLKIVVPVMLGGKELTVSLFSAQGRLIATQHIATKAGGKTYTAQFGSKITSTGIYLVKAKIGYIEKVLSIPVF